MTIYDCRTHVRMTSMTSSVERTDLNFKISVALVCILSQPHKEDILTGVQRHRAKKKERIKSRIGKVKKLKVILQKRLKTSVVT